MQAHELLQNRRAEVVSTIERLQIELIEIDKMLAAVSSVTQQPVRPVSGSVPATKDEAILQAIGSGCKTPAAIGDFIRTRLGMPVNDASTRTRLSRMKAADKIAHDGNGWKLKSGDE